jgi:hypothetical protein
MNAPLRRWILGAVLVATLAACIWPTGDETSAAQVIAPLQGRRSVMQEADHSAALTVRTGRLNRSQWMVAASGDPFKKAGVALQPVAAEVPAPPPSSPTPASPTPPWQFAGHVTLPNEPPSVLLIDAEKTYTVAIGQALSDWRLEADHGRSLDLTHIPTGYRTSLALTGAGVAP